MDGHASPVRFVAGIKEAATKTAAFESGMSVLGSLASALYLLPFSSFALLAPDLWPSALPLFALRLRNPNSQSELLMAAFSFLPSALRFRNPRSEFQNSKCSLLL